MLKRLLITFFSVFILAILLFFVISSAEKIQPRSLVSNDVLLSQQVLSDTLAQLRNNSGHIELVFKQPELDALMNVASYALPGARFDGVINRYGVALSGHAPLLSTGRTVRVACLLLLDNNRFSINRCQLGKLPVPGMLANWLLRWTLRNVVASPADEQLLSLFAKGRLDDEQLSFIDKQASPIVLNLQPALYNPVALLQTDVALAPDVMFYLKQLDQLQRQYPRERRLAFFALNVLNTAHQRRDRNSNDNTISTYHNAAWALIVAFGNRKFIHYANAAITINKVPKFGPALLSGRHDLAQHFLYSAAIKLISSAQLSTQIGNLKELMDAAAGGSGFSFVDLAADRAGIAFATQLDSLQHANLPLYNSISFEQAIIPHLHDLPEGLTEQQLELQYGGHDGVGFKQLERDIMARIAALPLYRSTLATSADAM
ncbi:hypothetical protein [Rheinheimera maricola]|uniref:Uncharacterized protein n=1 Tax=Rheinheimera maricola TaxID=2793282 RepID=A0ABS7X866_9GAMM|nr:hypothetical protein [Rheinheimera maricola]MBZ9611738.1 hypothetical protein [Rheinheimera maricola]